MSKKSHWNKHGGRSYTYDIKYENSPTQIKNRVARNKARAEVLEYLTSKYGAAKAKAMIAGKDIDHIKALSHGGSTKKSNTRIRSIHANRGDKKY